MSGDRISNRHTMYKKSTSMGAFFKTSDRNYKSIRLWLRFILNRYFLFLEAKRSGSTCER
jgi:hypothetical protein